MLEVITEKKRAYTKLYNNIVKIQSSYIKMSNYLNREIAAMVPSNRYEVKKLDAMEAQLQAADSNIDRFEEIKFWFNLAVLSEGALMSSTEIATLIDMIETAITTAEKEAEIDQTLETWANQKITTLSTISQILTEIVDHKVNKKISTGEIKLQ